MRECKIEDPFAVKKQIFERPIEGKIVDVPKPQPSQAVKEEAPLAIKPETTTPRMPMPPVEKAAIVQLPKEEPKMLVPKLQKVSEPVIKTKDLIEEKLAPAEKEETIPEVYPFETTLELYSAPENISSGDKVVFRGRLFKNKTGKGISDAKIHIYERDKSILGDDYLAYGSTGPDGSFAIPWRTRSLTWRKETGIIYAKFGGNEKAKSSQSVVQEITIK